jgi:hypothetical protein
MTCTLKHLLWLGAALVTVTASAATFSISRIALAFDELKPPAIVERGNETNVQAEISFSGNGLLKAVWEVAGPNPDGNNPQYRTLSNVNQYLVGRDTASLKGPRLPTESTGSYLVRLRVIEPIPAGFETPLASYNVIEKRTK